MQRLFVALSLPAYAREALDRLREPERGIRWIVPENFHLTLFFLGEVEGDLATKLREHLRAIEVAPFFLPVQGVGHFPPKGRPTVLWAGVGGGHPHLFQLRQRLADLFFRFGFDPGERAWTPHVTLARCGGVSEETVRQWEKKNRDFETAPVRIEDFSLFASERRGPRRLYPLVETFPLATR